MAKLDDVALDKIGSLVDGDIELSEENFFEEHLKQFTDVVPAWIHSTLPGKKRKADRKSTRLNSSHLRASRMPSSA